MQFQLNRRRLLVCSAAGVATTAGLVQAQDKTPVRFVVPASAGSGIDTILRAVTQPTSKVLRITIGTREANEAIAAVLCGVPS